MGTDETLIESLKQAGKQTGERVWHLPLPDEYRSQLDSNIADVKNIGSNWGGALVPWRLIHLPSGELGAPTADINTTVALALLVSLSYFYAGLSNKGLRYFEYYVHPTPIMLPFKIVEDFTKPLSLSFRLFGNILADELDVAVLVFLVPLVLPVPVMFLGLFTSAILALIFATLAAYYIGEAVEEHH